MKVLDVIKWLLSGEATREERDALETALGYVQRAEAAPATLPVNFGHGFTGEVVVLDKQGNKVKVHESPATLPPGNYTTQIKDVKAPTLKSPPKAFNPQSSFTKKWWTRLQRASVPMTAQQLAAAGGRAEQDHRVSTDLGMLFRRGLVTRTAKTGTNGFLYSFKKR